MAVLLCPVLQESEYDMAHAMVSRVSSFSLFLTEGTSPAPYLLSSVEIVQLTCNHIATSLYLVVLYLLDRLHS